MAIVTNPFLQGARGKIGNMVFSTRNGKTRVRMTAQRRSNRPLTDAQRKVQDKFRAASDYAKYACGKAEVKALYDMHGREGKGAYHLAMRDALHTPIIRVIDTEKYHGLPGDEIYIQAVDDFKVKSVLVSIIDEDGNILEQGDAVELLPGLEWVYEAKVENTRPRGCAIRVTARDLPGNKGSLEVII